MTATKTDYDKAKEAVLIEAKSDALAFFEEFGEPLDPALTDWDGVAWTDVVSHYNLSAFDFCDELWPIYQAALVAETKRLCGE